jgi:hypothetical protein
MSDIEKRDEPTSKDVEAHKDRVGMISRVAALGAGAVCIASGIALSFQGADPSVLHPVFIAGTTLFGLAISGKIFLKD